MADNMIFTGVASTPINPVMDRIYFNPMKSFNEGCEDTHVRAYIAYGKTADHKLYLESSYTTQINQADVEYAFRRGMLVIFDGTNYLTPVAMAANKVSTVGGTTSAATLVEWTAKVTV